MRLSKDFLKKRAVPVFTLLGMLAGYIFFHPFTEIVHAFFHVHRDEGVLHLHWNEVLSTFRNSFSLEHLPEGIAISLLTGAIGFLLGKLFLSYGKKEEKLRDLALVDGLTKLYNRKGFISFANQVLQHADRTKKGLLLVFVDLNNMKWINDKFGHTEGDRTLACVAQSLKDTFRLSDIISRIGGDEFAILAVDAKQEDIDIVRKRLDENLKAAECNISTEYRPSLSSGIVYYDPDNPCSIEDLLSKADMLMYEEKRKNKRQE